MERSGICEAPLLLYDARCRKPHVRAAGVETPMATSPAMEPTTDLDAVRDLLSDELGLSAAAARHLHAGSALFGDLPELDSMAVARVLTAIENRFGIVVDDDEVDGDLFATLGSLTAFVTRKRGR